MKRSLLATTAFISLVLPVIGTSCALEDAPPPVASGGKGGSAGGTAQGATSGSGGSGGGAEVITVDTLAGTVNEFGFAWKDSFLMVPCYSVSGVDCLVVQG